MDVGSGDAICRPDRELTFRIGYPDECIKSISSWDSYGKDNLSKLGIKNVVDQICIPRMQVMINHM